MADSEVSDDEQQTVGMDEATDVITNIMVRVIQQCVPAVNPDEQSAISPTEATELAAWAGTADKDLVNAFMDKKFEEYRLTVSNDSNKSEQQIRATWSRDNYYLHLQAFKAEHAAQILGSEAQEDTASEDVVWTALCALLPDTHTNLTMF